MKTPSTQAKIRTLAAAIFGVPDNSDEEVLLLSGLVYAKKFASDLRALKKSGFPADYFGDAAAIERAVGDIDALSMDATELKIARQLGISPAEWLK